MESFGARHVRGLVLGNWHAYRVVRQDRIDHPPTWLVSVNAAHLGEYLDRKTAMARIEADIEHNMQMVLNDWGLSQAAKEKR